VPGGAENTPGAAFDLLGRSAMRAKFTPNNYRIDGDVAYLALARAGGAVVAEAIVDADDLERVLRKARWSADWDKHARSYYVRATSKSPRVSLHRFVLNAPAGVLVDHANTDTLDCRKSNLRQCTVGQNNQNRKGPNVGSTSGARNVSWNQETKRWRVRLKVAGRSIHVGYFDNVDDAAAAAESARAVHMKFSVR
jgi:hypothetical protein